ncbi:MAG TPA: TylF/MycF/NovP-related O-methyltransferase [Tepidisphaeraceae bacterium]
MSITEAGIFRCESSVGGSEDGSLAAERQISELEATIRQLQQGAVESQSLIQMVVGQLRAAKPNAPAIYEGLTRVPDLQFYRASEHGDYLFSPWLGYGEFGALLKEASQFSAISPERLWTLYTMASQALNLDGDLVECGVWRGGSAMLFSRLLHRADVRENRRLYLFDTFAGMPPTSQEHDPYYRGGEFADTSAEAVLARLPHRQRVEIRKGFIPDTFAGLENLRVSFAHVDVDIYDSIKACCEFLYPRLVVGGIMVFDDYAWSTCAGARKAVDDYFAALPVRPLVLSNGQAIVFKSRS